MAVAVGDGHWYMRPTVRVAYCVEFFEEIGVDETHVLVFADSVHDAMDVADEAGLPLGEFKAAYRVHPCVRRARGLADMDDPLHHLMWEQLGEMPIVLFRVFMMGDEGNEDDYVG